MQARGRKRRHNVFARSQPPRSLPAACCSPGPIRPEPQRWWWPRPEPQATTRPATRARPFPALRLGAGAVSGVGISGADSVVVEVSAGTFASSSVTSTAAGFTGSALVVTSLDGSAAVTDVNVSAELTAGGGKAISLGDSPHTVSFDRVTATGSYGIDAAGGSGAVLAMKRSTITGYLAAVADNATGTAALHIEDSVLRVLGSAGAALRLSGLSLAGSYQLDSVTMFAQPGLTGTHGVELATSDGDSRSVTVRGSIFDNFAFDTYTSYATAGGSPTSSITINTTRLDAGSAQYGNTGGPRPPVFSGSRITSDPSFVNGPTGDFRLKRGSAMIDRGAWSVTLPPGRGTLDLRGDIRLSDGNQDNVKTTDMGAYEFQGGPRQLSPTGVPTSVLGSMRVASKATCDPGAWVYTEGSVRTFAWYRGTHHISGQDKRYYRIRKGDFKKLLRCQVIFTSADTVTRSRSAGRKVVSRFAETSTPLNNN